MKIALVPGSEPVRSWVRGAADTFADGSADHLAEEIRAHALALGAAPRAHLVRRVASLLGAQLRVDEQRIEEICAALERRGDVVRAPGGLLAPAPLRMVETAGDRYLVSGVAPTVLLRERLPSATISGGIGRVARVPTAGRGELSTSLGALGGVCLSAADWSRLSRTPAADESWIASLEQRLSNEGTETAGLTARWDDPFVYSAREAIAGGTTVASTESRATLRWERASVTARPRLLRARQIGGWQAYGYGVLRGSDGAPKPFIALTSDEARRTERALDRAEGAPKTLSAEERGGLFWTALTVGLPSAEYRFLLAHAEATEEGARPVEMGFSLEGWAQATDMLRERLGLDVRPARFDDSPDLGSKKGS